MTEEIQLGICMAAKERLEKILVSWRQFGQMVMVYMELPDGEQKSNLEREIKLHLKFFNIR